MAKKVLIVGYPGDYAPHEPFGGMLTDIGSIESNPKNISLVVFTGGADIDPKFYGHPKNEKSSCLSGRDKIDEFVYNMAIKHHIPMVGICRGGQLLTAKAGGFLYQHTTGHSSGNHPITTNMGKEFRVTSCHHQMFGWPIPGQILAWSSTRLSNVYELSSIVNEKPEKEVEVAYYPSINALAVQYHPEWMPLDSYGVVYYRKWIKDLLIGNKHANNAL